MNTIISTSKINRVMAEGQEVKLLGMWCSPFAHRIKWVLKLKGIEYEYVEQDLVNKSLLLLQYNPVHKSVPVLVHGTKPIIESPVILEYIDEMWKHNPIMPKDPYQRAITRFWAKFVDEKFSEVLRRALCLDGEQQEKEVVQARNALEILEEELKDKRFFGGDTIGFVDIVLGSTALYLGVVEEVSSIEVFNSLKYPGLGRWMDSILALPEIKDSVPPRDDLLVYFLKIRQYGLALAAKK